MSSLKYENLDRPPLCYRFSVILFANYVKLICIVYSNFDDIIIGQNNNIIPSLANFIMLILLIFVKCQNSVGLLYKKSLDDLKLDRNLLQK